MLALASCSSLSYPLHSGRILMALVNLGSLVSGLLHCVNQKTSKYNEGTLRSLPLHVSTNTKIATSANFASGYSNRAEQSFNHEFSL